MHNNTKSLTPCKLTRNRTLLKETHQKNWWTWQTAKILLGNINFASWVVPYLLFYRILQIETNKLPGENRNKQHMLPTSVKEELCWWRKNIARKLPLHRRDPTIFVSTDAAELGWGTTVNGVKLSSLWNHTQRIWHSIQKELWALSVKQWWYKQTTNP